MELGGRRMIVLPALPKSSAQEKLAKDKEENPMTLNKVRTLDDLIKLDKNAKRKVYLSKIGLFEQTPVSFLFKKESQFLKSCSF